MKECEKDCRRAKWIKRGIGAAGACLILLGYAAAARVNLTEEEPREVVSEAIKAMNEGCEEMEKNPLTVGASVGVKEAVSAYYTGLAKSSDFVEDYLGITVYTKLGKYRDTYVAFVRYDMKIRDIYTKVPGLGTLYVEKNTDDGTYGVRTGIDEELQEYVSKIAGHADVQEIMKEVQDEYAAAVASDALLREALRDLRSVSEDTGYGPPGEQ